MHNDQPIDTTIEQDDFLKTPSKRKRISFLAITKNTWKFIKNHRTFFVLLIIAIIINFIVYLAIPVIDAGKTKFVNLNTDVRIEMNQKVKLKFSNTSVVVVNFTNDTCPAGKECFGTGAKAVEYTLSFNGDNYATGSMTPAVGSDYQVKTVSSDYESHAIIQIIKTDSVK